MGSVTTQSLILIRTNVELDLCHKQYVICLDSVPHMANSAFQKRYLVQSCNEHTLAYSLLP